MNIDLGRLMATEEKPGDYVGSDGLLYCGKCHTPKQMWLSFDPSTGGKKQTLVHTACKCQKEAREAERERAEHERFLQDMARRREDGISCPDGLR